MGFLTMEFLIGVSEFEWMFEVNVEQSPCFRFDVTDL